MARPSKNKNSDDVNTNSKVTKSTAKKQDTPKKAPAKSRLRSQSENEIFALDIGTRTVVGVLGYLDKSSNIYHVVSKVTVPHTQRAMIDGQIEDINEVARIVKIVKAEFEKLNGIKLKKVAIAAAGRALKTRRAELEFDISEKDALTDEVVKSFEVDTVLSAQAMLDEDVKNDSLIFYCVGHTVISYTLDDYKIKTFIGHRGKTAKVDLIAAFLPNIVVESLYAVMDLCSLEVSSLTLEPIAAMNVIIPPEVRLINVALVDIGAGTSDIAISQNGSIVAYAMSTLAGDEITEEIIRNYLVDFQTAEEMKLSGKSDYIKYTDILGFEHEIRTIDFYESLFPSVEKLTENICEHIIQANGKAPAAVFLVGGGSLVPNISKVLADKLGLAENRVAIGGSQALKHIDFGNSGAEGPEFVTPIGIGVTATINKGYDFSVVTINDKKMRIFDTRTVSLIDLLVLAGYKTTQIIGRSGRSLAFTLNGEKQKLKGEMALPASIVLNGNQASIDTPVKQGDIISFDPAVSGKNAECKLSDIAGDVSEHFVTVDDVKYNFGVIVTVNGKIMKGDYQIQNFDDVKVSEIETLGDLMLVLPFAADSVSFYVKGKLIGIEYYLKDGDDIFIGEKVKDSKLAAGALAKAISERELANRQAVSESIDSNDFDNYNNLSSAQALSEELQNELREFMAENPNYEFPDNLKKAADVTNNGTDHKKDNINETSQKAVSPEISESINNTQNDEFYVILNGKHQVLPERAGESKHEFIELIGVADIDLDKPSASGNMILLLNGNEASFMSVLSKGDEAVIKWADK